LSRVTGLVWLLVRFAEVAAVIVERDLRETGDNYPRQRDWL
jgi:hypothetical protein